MYKSKLKSLLEEPEVLITLRRTEIFNVNLRIPKHLPDQSGSARDGQAVHLFQTAQGILGKLSIQRSVFTIQVIPVSLEFRNLYI